MALASAGPVTAKSDLPSKFTPTAYARPTSNYSPFTTPARTHLSSETGSSDCSVTSTPMDTPQSGDGCGLQSARPRVAAQAFGGIC